MVTRQKNLQELSEDEQNLVPVYARSAMEGDVPKYDLPDKELNPDLAHNLIHDELMRDGNARLNLATFVTTWMEPPVAQDHRLSAKGDIRKFNFIIPENSQ